MAHKFPIRIVRQWEADSRQTAAENADRPDTEQLCLFFSPAEQSVLAVHALMLGLRPPDGIPPSVWAETRAGRCEAMTFPRFASFCDAAGPELLDGLSELRRATRPQWPLADALAAR